MRNLLLDAFVSGFLVARKEIKVVVIGKVGMR